MPGGLATGQLVDERYALEDPLGEDALGTTWRAHDRGLGRGVHLREVRYPGDLFAEDPSKLKQALMAARLAIRLDHPGAVHVYDAFIDGDRLMIVTEAEPTTSLAALVARKGPLAPKRVAAIGLDLLDPLAAAHAKNLVHGAISPEAVLAGERGRALLTGLGLAPTFVDESSEAWMDAVGVASCLAPEQVELRGAAAASDLWGLGATLWFAVEGAYPFDARTDVVERSTAPATRAGALRPVLEKLLSKEPAWRPGLDDLRADLSAVAGIALDTEEAGSAAPGRRRERGARRRAAPEPVGAVESDATDATGGGDGPNWELAIPAAGADETAWTDWEPAGAADTSDVWLDDAPIGDGIGDDEFAADEDEAEFGAGAEATAMAPITAEPALPDDPWAESARAGAGVSTPDLTMDLAEPIVTDTRDQLDMGSVVDESFWRRDPPEAPDAAADAAADADVAPPELPAEPEETPKFRSSPSWPPPVRRRSVWVIGLCSLVMVVMVLLLVTNGRLGGSGTPGGDQAADRPVLATDPNLVPRDWIAYRHPSVDFTVSYPPKWVLREEGSLVTIRDPATGTELRVDYRKTNADPEQTWLNQERDFLVKHPTDYKRLQLSPANYLGHVAALWEYTYLENNQPVHAVDLGFRTDDFGFSMSFRAPAGTWDTMLGVFQGFLSSVRAPN